MSDVNAGSDWEFADYFWKATKSAHPRMRDPSTQQWGKWLSSATKLFEEIEEREVIWDVALWFFQSDSESAVFWRSRILTLPEFRMKFDRLEALRSYEEDAPSRGAARSASPVLDAAQRIMARAARAH